MKNKRIKFTVDFEVEVYVNEKVFEQDVGIIKAVTDYFKRNVAGRIPLRLENQERYDTQLMYLHNIQVKLKSNKYEFERVSTSSAAHTP